MVDVKTVTMLIARYETEFVLEMACIHALHPMLDKHSKSLRIDAVEQRLLERFKNDLLMMGAN